MGWRGYKGTIAAGMIFKKMYCHNCGTKLKIKKSTIIISKSEEKYSNKMPGKGNSVGMSSYYDVTYLYWCPICDKTITYDEQCIVAKKQKQLKQRIICKNDLDL